MPNLPDDLAQYLATDDGRAAEPIVRDELVRLRVGLGYALTHRAYTELQAAFSKAVHATTRAAAEA